MDIKDAIIDRSQIITDFDGFHAGISVYIRLNYGRVGRQRFGTNSPYLKKKYSRGELMENTGMFIWRILEVAGVASWDDLVGHKVRVKGDRLRVYSIGHITEDDWFCPEKEFSGG